MRGGVIGLFDSGDGLEVGVNGTADGEGEDVVPEEPSGVRGGARDALSAGEPIRGGGFGELLRLGGGVLEDPVGQSEFHGVVI